MPGLARGFLLGVVVGCLLLIFALALWLTKASRTSKKFFNFISIVCLTQGEANIRQKTLFYKFLKIKEKIFQLYYALEEKPLNNLLFVYLFRFSLPGFILIE
jgi:hypothetical protein